MNCWSNIEFFINCFNILFLIDYPYLIFNITGSCWSVLYIHTNH